MHKSNGPVIDPLDETPSTDVFPDFSFSVSSFFPRLLPPELMVALPTP